AEKQFVWNAMNYWYYWQGDVTDLADSFDDDSTAFQQYLKRHSDAEALYDDLKFRDDRFSFFIDDYEEYLQERSGVHAALGFNYNFFWKTKDRKSTRLNSSHVSISYAVFCLKKKKIEGEQLYEKLNVYK